MEQKKKATINDVAKKAKVSRQTVSRVLSNSELVAESTRERVLSAIKALYYRPDPVARSLVNRRTYLIGVIITTFTGYTRDRILAGAESEAQKQHYNLFICGAKAEELGEPVKAALLNTQRYEGLLILYRGSKKDHFAIMNEIYNEIPVVTIGYRPHRDKLIRIVSEHKKGGYLATKHLIELGHKKIATITGIPGRYDVIERLEGYKRALKENGIPFDPGLVFHSDWTAESSFNIIKRKLKEKIMFTAVFCQSDIIAIGCISALKDSARSIPSDVSVIGFDNIDIGNFIDPPLTTINHKIYETGRMGIQTLIECIEGRQSKRKLIKLPTELVVRKSTGFA